MQSVVVVFTVVIAAAAAAAVVTLFMGFIKTSDRDGRLSKSEPA